MGGWVGGWVTYPHFSVVRRDGWASHLDEKFHSGDEPGGWVVE